MDLWFIKFRQEIYWISELLQRTLASWRQLFWGKQLRNILGQIRWTACSVVPHPVWKGFPRYYNPTLPPSWTPSIATNWTPNLHFAFRKLSVTGIQETTMHETESNELPTTLRDYNYTQIKAFKLTGSCFRALLKVPWLCFPGCSGQLVTTYADYFTHLHVLYPLQQQSLLIEWALHLDNIWKRKCIN
jgi:hypothetical protein